MFFSLRRSLRADKCIVHEASMQHSEQVKLYVS